MKSLLILMLCSLGQINSNRNLPMNEQQSQERTTGFQQTGELSSDAAIQRDPNAVVGDNSGSFLSRTQSNTNQQPQQSIGSQADRGSQRQRQQDVAPPIRCRLIIGFKVKPRDYEKLKKRLTKMDGSAIIVIEGDEVKIFNSTKGYELSRIASFEPGIRKVTVY